MVKIILLVRHAAAKFPTAEKKDFERKLTLNGIKQATLLGVHIADYDLSFDALYHSPSVRTIETSNYLLAQLPYPIRLMEAEELYEATTNLMRAFISRIDPKFNNVIIMAHNPTIAELFTYYVSDIRGFSPATAALLTFKVNNWQLISGNMASLVDYY